MNELHPIDAAMAEARAAIAAMRAAAETARRLHARAELLRHMRTTATRMVGLPLDAAVAKVAGEWMAAWSLDADAYPEIAAEVTSFTRAFCVDARTPDAASARAVGVAADALDAAFARIGTSIGDQMAFRSECAHGWWEAVMPTPTDLPGLRERGHVPKPQPGEPFWRAGAAPHCGAAPIED